MTGKIVADAAVMVADAALNGVFQGLSQALTPIIQKKLGQFWGVEDKKLKKLKRYILGVQPLLNDAETRQFTDEAVRSWVSDLRGVAYDMEDIVDEMNTELLRLELEETKKSEGKQVGDFISSYFRGHSFNYQISGKINEVLEKWEEIVEYGDTLHLRDDNIGGRVLEVIGKRRETTSLVVKSGVVGRDIEKGKILSFLKSDKSSARSGNLSVIAIVGMGGLGKTTLAKLAYNEAVGFDPKGWIHVSHEFDCVRVTRSIIESITNALCELRVLDMLQRRLEELVRNKKVLLVLDDAWTENPDDWVTLTMPLRSALKGSKIIVTTRSEVVSKSVGVDEMYTLKRLSDDDCWAVVKEKLLGCNNIADGLHPHLEKVRVEVVRKCNGLPLTANMLGGLLSTTEIDKWERLLKSEIWDLPKTKVDILPALMLSYLCLPSHIKRCFAYTAIFPKGERFRPDELVRLWMAEGFIEAGKSDTLEDSGNDYFDHLVARHFLQKRDDPDCYVMHDLIHDLAEEILGRSIFLRMQNEVVTNTPTEETRYMSLSNIVIDKTLLRNLSKAKGLRTLWVRKEMFPGELDEVMDEVNHTFERLHVLIVHDFATSAETSIPESIGNLKYLRYLNLQGNYIKRLPDSICDLYNLQTLHIDYNKDLDELPKNMLDELPKDIGSLISLRHLTLRYTGIKRLPDSICGLYNLQALHLDNNCDFDELPEDIGSLISLRHLTLTGTIIKRLPDSICGLYNLQSLHLDYTNLHELPKDMGSLSSLRHLTLRGPKIKRLPDSICGLYNLQTLHIHYNFQLDELPKDIGSLISLRHLSLQHTGIKRLPDSICKLKKLEGIDLSCCLMFTVLPIDIGNLINLHSLTLNSTDIERLPSSICELHNLRSLDLSNCTKLSELPKEMTNLINLRKLEVDQDILKSWLLPMIGRFPNLQGLQKYFVAKESGIGQLCALANLHEKFKIKDLENIESAEEARTANLKDKYGIHSLRLQWSRPDPLNLWDENVEAAVLEALEPPCAELRHLVIENYSGFKFPSWMGNTSFSKLVHIELINCRKAKLLAPLGQLPSLEKLVIKRMYELKHIGREVFGKGSFPSLQRLKLKDLPNLEGHFEVQDGDFLHLIELEIWNCPKITLLPIAPLTLRALGIYGCKQEIGFAAFPVLASLEELEVGTSLQDGLLQHLTNLKTLKIVECSDLLTLRDGIPSSLESLDIDSCPELTSLPDELPSSLGRLHIKRCTKFKSLPKGLPSSLSDLYIDSCAKLTSLPNELPSSLEVLFIKGCPKIKSLPNGLASSLRSLVINSCAELTSLPDELPSSLEKLRIVMCPKIKSLPNGLASSLRSLVINSCAEITSLPNDLPSSLEYLLIEGCPRIKSLPNGLHKLTSLQTLIIGNCPLIESFPEDGFPINLGRLDISGCPMLVQRCELQGSREWNIWQKVKIAKFLR